MQTLSQVRSLRLSLLAGAALAFASGAFAQEMKLTLSGDAEVPPVKTAATGNGTIKVAPDMSVSGEVTATGFAATMAHIHEAPAGQMNGAPIIPLKQEGDKFVVPAGAKLTEAQYKALKAGNLYVNVHSAATPGGEVRAQLKP